MTGTNYCILALLRPRFSIFKESYHVFNKICKSNPVVKIILKIIFQSTFFYASIISKTPIFRNTNVLNSISFESLTSTSLYSTNYINIVKLFAVSDKNIVIPERIDYAYTYI